MNVNGTVELIVPEIRLDGTVDGGIELVRPLRFHFSLPQSRYIIQGGKRDDHYHVDPGTSVRAQRPRP